MSQARPTFVLAALTVLSLSLSAPLAAQTFSKQQLAQQYRLTCSPQNLRTLPGLAFQCQQWRAAIEAMDGGSDAEAEVDDESLDVTAQRAPSLPARQSAQGSPQSPSINQCIRFRADRQADGWLVWEFTNLCADEVSVSWCNNGATCRSPSSEHTLRGGEVYRTGALERQSPGPRWLACPTSAYNAMKADVWACWTKR
jgi:hypothetical protein